MQGHELKVSSPVSSPRVTITPKNPESQSNTATDMIKSPRNSSEKEFDIESQDKPLPRMELGFAPRQTVITKASKTLEDLINSMDGAFIVFKSMDFLRFTDNLCTIAVVYNWNLSHPKLDDRGKDKFIIQLQRGIKKKRKIGYKSVEQYIIKT